MCKALGLPATVVTGRGKSGIGHAWVACLKVTRGGKNAYWDSSTGRYQTQKYYIGELNDPATGRKILDNELMLVGSAAQLPLSRREEADAAVALARMVDRLRDKEPAYDLDVLRRWAVRYERRNVDDKTKPRVPTDWIAQRRKIDLAMVEDLIAAAVDRNLAHKPAWELVVSMRKSGRLPVEHLGRFFDVLVTRTAKKFPDYSCSLVMRIVPTIPDAAKREKIFKRALGIYGRRPDLYGQILIAVGDDYFKQDRKAKALRAYEGAAMRCVDLAGVVLVASARAESLLRDARQQKMAINMYKKLFSKAKKRKSAFSTQTAHYQLGKRLAGLLKDAGRNAEAKRVEDRL